MEIKVNLYNLTQEEKDTIMKLVEKSNRKKVWKPEGGDNYWFITSNGTLFQTMCIEGENDTEQISIGNFFRTKEEAKFMIEKLKVLQELREYAAEHNEGEIDWSNPKQGKCIITFNHKHKEINAHNIMHQTKDIGQVYFTSEKIAKEAIKEVGEDRIKKYLFGVDENAK